MSDDQFKEPQAPARGLRTSGGSRLVLPPLLAMSTALEASPRSRSGSSPRTMSPRNGPENRSEPSMRSALTRSEMSSGAPPRKGSRHDSPKAHVPLPHGSSVYSPRWIHAVKRETDKQVLSFLETLMDPAVQQLVTPKVLEELNTQGNAFLRIRTDALGEASKSMVRILQTLLPQAANPREKRLVVQLLMAISSCSRLDEYIASVREAERASSTNKVGQGDRRGYDGQFEYQKTESPRLRDSASKRANFLSQSLNGDDMEAFIQLIPTGGGDEAGVNPLEGFGANEGAANEDDGEVILCRVCETMIDKPIYAKHVKFCSKKMGHDFEVLNTDQDIAKLLVATPPGLEEGSAVRSMMEKALAITAAQKGGFYECNGLKKEVDAVVDTLSTATEKAVVQRCAELIVKKMRALQNVEIAVLQSPRLPSPSTGRLPGAQGDERTPSTGATKIPSILDFEILKPITRGGFGGVYLARKKATHDLYAIKAINRKEMIRRGEMKSIFAERNILATVHSDHVVRMFFAMASKRYLFFVMEFMSGGDCFSLLRRFGRFDEGIAKFYVAEVVLALEDIHAQGVVHRDVKPDNILIGSDGHIKLADFGLSAVGLINKQAREGDEPEQPTPVPATTSDMAEHVKGTPHYLAPEILLGLPHDQAVDWWALGVMLFEFCNGVPPFDGASVQDVFSEIFAGNIGWPTPEYDEMSDSCKNLISRLLETDPRQRLTEAVRVKAHPFFVSDDLDFWLTLTDEEPPFVPEQKSEDDTSNFDERIEFFSMDVDERIGEDDGSSGGCGVTSSGGDTHTSSSSDSDEESSRPLANDSGSNLQNFWHVNVTNLAARTD